MCGAKCGIRLFANFREMLSESPADVVCVASPAPSHAPIALVVLEQGVRGLLLEKPLACDVSSAEALLWEVRNAACPVVVPHGMLVLPAAKEIKARIRRGDIGQIVSVHVQNAVDLLNGGIHWLAYLLDVFDDVNPGIVNAEFDVSDRVVGDGVQVESRGCTSIELESGLQIELHSGQKTKPSSDVLSREEIKGAVFRVTGLSGIIEFSAWAGSYWIQTGESDGELVKRPLPAGLGYHQIFMEQLAQTIAAGKTEYGGAELSLTALRLIESAYKQDSNSEWVLGVPVR